MGRKLEDIIKKPKENNTNLIIKNTAKVFKYNAGVESIVDGNTVQLPFIAEYKGDRKTALEYIWHTKDLDGTAHKRGIMVSGHGEYGVPTLYDYDVYVALQDIFINKNSRNGICELKQEDITDDDLSIQFTINELAREMGYKSPSNPIRENLKKSIRTLLATTIFSMYEGGIYDINKKKYIINREQGYHYLEEANGFKITNDEGEDEVDITKIKLSRFTYNQILNDYKLFYNRESYMKVKNRMAKKVYHILLQWKGNKDKLYVSLDKIVEKIPMIESERRYQKRYIKDALKKLSDNDVIKVTFDNKDKNLLCCDFTNGRSDIKLLEKYNKYDDIKNYLYSIGFSFLEIDEYASPEKIRHLQAILRYINDRNKDKMGAEKVKKYIITALNNPLIDKKYYNEEYNNYKEM